MWKHKSVDGIFFFFSPTFKLNEDNCQEKRLVIIQCDSGHLNGDLIACARYRIHDLKIKADNEQITHVLFIIHLPHQVRNSSFVGFQGHPWISSHIDDLRPSTDHVVSANEAIGLTISQIFLGSNSENPDINPRDESEYTGLEFFPNQGNDNSVDEVSEGLTGPNFVRTDSEEMPSAGETESDSEGGDANIQGPQNELDMQTEGMEVCHEVSLPTEEQVVVDELAAEGDSEGLMKYGAVERETTFERNRANQHTSVSSRSPLFCRLHGCIQAAASKLNDITAKRSTKRIEIMVSLIPKEPPKVLGMYSHNPHFCGLLIIVLYVQIPPNFTEC